MSPQPIHPARTRHRRRLLVIFFIMGLLAGGWAWRMHAIRGDLRLVTHRVLPRGCRLLFSANNLGYPALQSTIPRRHEEFAAHWLDDQCRVGRRATDKTQSYNIIVSPARGSVIWTGELLAKGQQVHLVGREGRRRDLLFSFNHNFFAKSVTNDGSLFAISADGYFTADGKPARIPGFGTCWSIERGWQSADPNILPLHDDRHENLVLYDRAQGRVLYTIPERDNTGRGIIFTQDRRLVVVPSSGIVHVFENGKQLASFGNGVFQWIWGEDGTVWNLYDYRLLQWRSGKPRLVSHHIPINFDPDFYHPTELTYAEPGDWQPTFTGEAWAALWGDDALGATVETVPLIPMPLMTAMAWIQSKTKWQFDTRLIGRQLTLYRNGKPAGRIAIRPPRPTKHSPYGEHLAFTRDGKYLAWVIACGERVEIYAFRIR